MQNRFSSSVSFQQYFSTKYFSHLGCVSLKQFKIGFLNPKESESGFCVSLLNRLIQDLSFGSWCVKGTEESSLEVNSSVPLRHHDQ